MGVFIGPNEFFISLLGCDVIVKTISGDYFRGVLECLDEKMNLVMSDAKEFASGRLKKVYQRVMIRGNNVLFLFSREKKKKEKTSEENGVISTRIKN